MDPITQASECITARLIAYPAVTQIVTKYRRNLDIVDFHGGDIDPRSEVNTESDVASILRIATGGSTNLVQSSGSVEVRQTFEVQLNTGSFNVDKLLELKFALLCACVALNFDETLNGLQWKNLRYVTDIAVTDMSEGTVGGAENRGIGAFVGVWTLELAMSFSRERMIAFATTGE